MDLVGLLQKTDPVGKAAYLAFTMAFQTWCCNSLLEMNVSKTKEVI